MGLIFFLLFVTLFPLSDEYDPLDPYGNVTIKWDFLHWTDAAYDVKVSIQNNQLFRHVEYPGWELSWTWGGDEVIWGVWGGEATEQGNCSRFRGAATLPHCCEKRPVIVDLLAGAPYNMQVANCCKGGVLSSSTQDHATSVAAFQMSVALPSISHSHSRGMPRDFELGLAGYSCGDPTEVPPTRLKLDRGRRWTQTLKTWEITCSYSQFRASPAPTCCVSLSAFYNNTIIPCPQCSCGCQGQLSSSGEKCVKEGESLPPQLQRIRQGSDDAGAEGTGAVVRCSRHMCPIRVHWHVKLSYTQYWRVKITVTNLNYGRNYSDWNLVALHPNLHSVTRVFSFNYQALADHSGYVNDTGMFWGIQHYNDMLLQSGDGGNVETEMLLHKDAGVFTFREGWAFPRKISFNGDECVMPPPDHYPTLPNRAAALFPQLPPFSLACMTLFSSIFQLLLAGLPIMF